MTGVFFYGKVSCARFVYNGFFLGVSFLRCHRAAGLGKLAGRGHGPHVFDLIVQNSSP